MLKYSLQLLITLTVILVVGCAGKPPSIILEDLDEDRSLTEAELKENEDQIFVTLIYPDELIKDDHFLIDNQRFYYIDHFNFVAIKNGEHNGNGFLLDTNQKHNNQPLREIKKHVLNNFK